MVVILFMDRTTEIKMALQDATGNIGRKLFPHRYEYQGRHRVS